MIFIVTLLLFIVSSSKAFVIQEDCLDYTIYPIQYDLTITPYIYNKRESYYDCNILITVIANAPNQIITLDAKDLEINDDSIKVHYGNRDIVNKFRPYEYDKVNGKISIYLMEPMVRHTLGQPQYNITMSFRKYMKSETNSGIFIVPYEDGGTMYLYVTRLSPDKAKYFFPCFNNARFESVYKFKVYQVPNRPGLQHSNTSLVISKEQEKYYYHRQEHYEYVIKYVPSPQVALHELGFHYSQFGSRDVTANNTQDTILLWAPPSKLQNYDFILSFGKKMLDLVIEYSFVNRSIVNGPINVVSVPTMVKGYEVGSWNLLTNGDNRLAYVPQFTSISQAEQMTYELAQQLCRIWLGNPGEVTKRTRWHEEWFKEGVATYLAYYFLTQYQHGIDSLRYRVPLSMYGLQIKHKAMAKDWGRKTPDLISFNKKLAVEFTSSEAELIQMKTASLLWMIENWIGSDKFHTALVKYINKMRGQYISLDDFMRNLDLDTIECLNQLSNGTTATKVLNSWFHQTGYPVVQVNVMRDQTPNVIQLKQNKFSYNLKETRDTYYLIPISYIVQNNQNCFNCYRPRFTIEQTYSFKENLNDGWIILNTNASGYYRVNYDAYTWSLIAKTLKKDPHSIPELNRAQIVNDAFALYAAGEIDHALAVAILDYLDQETSPVVWDAVISGFDLLKTIDASCSMTEYLYKDWKEFMRAKVAPMYSHLAGDFEKQPTNRMFRRNIVAFACAVGHQLCIDALRYSYVQYLRGKRLDPDTRQTCYEIHFENDRHFAGQGFNEFEVEDKLAAQEKIREEKWFLHRIPMGTPVLGHLVMPSTTAPPLTSELVPNVDQSSNEHVRRAREEGSAPQRVYGSWGALPSPRTPPTPHDCSV